MRGKKGYIKIAALFPVFALMLSLTIPFVSAASDFTVENGVLLSYNGTEQNVSIPSDVFCIGDDAFRENSYVKSVHLNNVSVIGSNAFRDCTSLRTVNGFDNVASCGAYAFSGTPFLSDFSEQDVVMGSVLVRSEATGVYSIPANIKSIAPYAFAENSKLTSVSVGENVMTIGEGAFLDCSALKSVTVSNTVSHIGFKAFEGTEFLKTNQDEFLIMGNGILVNGNTSAADVTIPTNVKQIGAGAFIQSENLVSVTIPGCVNSIGKRAFAGCTSLKKADLPNSVISVEDEAFYGCTSLETVTIPQNVEILGDSAFLGCTSLKTAQVNTDAPLSAGLFAGCTKLEYVAVAMNPEYVMSYAFYGCSNLKEVSLPDSVSFIAQNAFEGADKLTVLCNAENYVSKTLKKYGVITAQVGDANSDGKLNVRDSTHIRKCVAGLITFDFSAQLRSDVDFNSVINVRDATKIQKLLVGVE